MNAILTIVAPIFGLIVIGYVAGRFRLVSEQAGQGIADFAFTLAIPALLCRTIATAELGTLSPVAIWGSFYTAGFLTWIAATLATRFLLGRPAADAPAIAMTSTFGNTIMLGLPLSMGVYGAEATAIVALILSIHAPTWWLTGMLHAEASGDYAGQSRFAILRNAIVDLARNPIVIGILAGALWRLTGEPLPAALDRLLQLMAQAGVPAALVALGLSLLKFEIKGQVATLALEIALKLLWMPALAWIFATYVFGLDSVTRGVVVIMAAVPTGANAFLFATRLGRAVDSTSGAVALGTLFAAATAAALVGALHGP